MLTIRMQQMEELGESSLDVFLDRVIGIFREEFPAESQGIPQQEMKREFRGPTEQAMTYGLLSEKEVFTYLWAAKYLGSDFVAVSPAAQKVLSSTQLTGETKMLWLQKWTLAVLEAQSEG
jgi:hypothetical protein